MIKLLLFLFLYLNIFASTFDITSLGNNSKKDNNSDAINTLKKYLNKIDFQLEKTNHINFYIGTKEEIKNSHNELYKSINSFTNDGFIIKQIKSSIYIIGVNKRSSLYAVYSFLERSLNCKFLSNSFEIVPSKIKMKNEKIDFKSEARFAYREIFIKELEDSEFAIKLGLNGSFGHKAKAKNDLFISTYNQFTPYELIDPKYKDLYPEFFCSGQLDFALIDVKEFANKSFQNKIKNYNEKKEDIFYIQHEDIQSFCNSRNSKKLIRKYYSNSASFLDYTNYIAKENLSKNIFFEAYQWSRKAPTNFPELSKNLNIFFSDIEANFAKPINQGANRKIYKDLLTWEKYNKDVYIWHYITNFNGYFQPYPNIITTAKDIKTYSKLNMVKGIFLQGAYEIEFSNLSNLRAWVFSKLLWNPNLNEQRLIKEFTYYYYGEANKDVLEYFQLLENEVKITKSKLLIKTSVNAKYLNDAFIKKAKFILDKALKKVEANSIYHEHLIELYSSIDYIELLKGNISNKNKNRFKKFLEKNQIKYYAEGSLISSLTPYFNIKRIKPKEPKKINNENKTWLDFQEYELKLCCTDIIKDNKASSLSTVRMDGYKSDWGVQLDIDNIPKGKWEIYANVRIKKSKDISSLDFIKPAMYYGIKGKGIKNLSLINTLKDEEYHEVFIGNVEVSKNETGQVWIRPPKDKAVKYIYIDRIFAIKE